MSSTVLDLTLFIKSSDLDVFWSHFEPLHKKCCDEPECTLFEIAVSHDESTGETTIKIFEIWAYSVEQFLETQVKKTYYEPYNKATMPLFSKPRVLELYESVAKYSHQK
ncbi:hypothetical protein IW261DRAFT_1421978 [Armillaria novae-zelandiae]|uniref:ABM domain-containing protein n=1 Tax=Armillaria novae-zelandiae TaxID=153914 RepID=A0AA39U2J6_9AGAR|nr:hypothetical protein IW261DRAFT_1421978 [Armillaria novae-zelandiae]